jgi:hypothetical protein
VRPRDYGCVGGSAGRYFIATVRVTVLLTPDMPKPNIQPKPELPIEVTMFSLGQRACS